MKYRYNELQDGQKIWACAYSLDGTKEGKRLKCEPVYGIVKITYRSNNPIYRSGMFFRLKGNGEPYANGVNISSRRYADTKEEAIELYNKLIDQSIGILEELVDDMRKEKI